MAPAELEELVAPPPFSAVVIGLGLIGSAAARHLSLPLGSSLLAIGPPEPSIPWSAHNGPFSSHYDQGRLARISDPDPVWAVLASRSMARYSALEEESGINFHYPVGSLRVSPLPDDSLHQSFEVGKEQGAIEEMIENCDTLRAEFPCFEFCKGDAAIMEHGTAGYINPRSMACAQLTIAERNGACIVRESVKEVVPIGYGVKIVTEKGRIFWARKALICAGSYTRFLIPGKHQLLDFKTHGRTVLLAEVHKEEEQRLHKMPTFIWRLPKHRYLNWIYGCPPTKYPDGRLTLKVGGTAWNARDVGQSEADLISWFHGDGDEEERAALAEVLLEELMPDLRVVSLSCKPCVVSFTSHGRPYIDAVDGDRPTTSARIFVAAGGCGAAAKSSDEIGHLAAGLVLNGRWGSDLDPALFRAVFKSKVLS